MTNSTNIQNGFIVAMPDDGPPLGFDPYSESFDWTEVLPDNFWSMETLEERRHALGGWPVLTPSHVCIQPVIDPTVEESQRDYSPKVVLYFQESCPALVLNKSRCQIAAEMTGSRNPNQWAQLLPQIVLMNDVYNKRAQIVFAPAPEGEGRNE